MYRAPVAFVALVSTGLSHPTPCTESTCPFDVQAFEEFSVSYDVVTVSHVEGGLATRPMPSSAPSDHGSIAVHARNLQLKVSSHSSFPPDTFPPDLYPLDLLNSMTNADIHEELHVDGIQGQASFHLSLSSSHVTGFADQPSLLSDHLYSPGVNLCIQIDNLPPLATSPQWQAQFDASIQQAEQVVPAMIHNIGQHVVVDGQPGFGIFSPPSNYFVVRDVFQSGQHTTHPELVTLPPYDFLSLGVKFDNYTADVGNEFAFRACEVESHSATQSLLSSNPMAREFVANRVADHQRRLQAVLEPPTLNTRFNFIPLNIADLMMDAVAPRGPPCSSDLAETSPQETNFLQTVSLGVCSFAMGVATTYGALRKKSVVTADAYHEVSA